MAPCSRLPQWYYHISAGLVSFIGGILVIGLARLAMFIYFRRAGTGWKELYDSSSSSSGSPTIHRRFSLFSRVRAAGRSLVSGDPWWSKLLVVFMWLLNMTSCLHFLVNVTKFSVDDCGPVRGDASEYAWLAMCCIFVCYYVVRFAAATDKLAMWTGIYSIVDHFTILPSFVGLYYNVNWLGLRFLRLLHILQVTDILQLTHVIKSNRHIRVVQVVTLLVGVWLCSAGFVHLTENNGDPFTHYDDDRSQRLTYWDCVYWLLITMSTVGYGDISPQTYVSRAFIIVFIMGTIAMFASVIPELVTAMASSNKYAKPYKRTYGKKHIVVCGHITYESVTPFLRNFVHADTKSKTRDTHVVFLGSNTPNLELEAFFRRNCNEITFIEGSAMDSTSLQNVKLAHADACVILANRKASDPDEADAETLMRVTAVKNYRPHIRVIVQLRRYQNKRYLLHIPGWSWERNHGDSIICISELSLAILAQNCLAPGFATLLSNLFTMRSSLPEKFNSWRDDYQYGASNEIYSETFSKSFYDLTFRQAAELCYLHHDVLLVAVNVCDKRRTHMKVNPGNDVVIKPGDVGFFIAQSSQQVARVAAFKGVVSYITKDSELQTKSDINSNEDELGLRETQITSYDDAGWSPPWEEAVSHDMLEGSGMFHWCPSRKLDDCLLDDISTREHNFRNHVIVIYPATASVHPVELVNFVLPLRASSFRYKELKDIIIFVKNVEFVRKTWEDITNFPNIYVYEGDISRRSDLRAVNVNRSAMSVILSNQTHIVIDDKHHIDKEAVLATLNIKAMCGQTLHRRLMLTSGSSEHRILELKRSIQMEDKTSTPFTTLLEIRSNVEFLEHDDDDSAGTPFYLTMTYASGRAFAVSMLDSLMSCVYINSDLLTMVRTLTTGASVAEYEQILADGLGLSRQQSLVDVSAARNRCRVAQLSLDDSRLTHLEHDNRYGRLFVQALNRYGILCLGLYRVMDPSGDARLPSRRFVMTHPPPSVNLLPTDQVFVLEPYFLEQTSGSVAGSCQPSATVSRASSGASSRRCGSRADRPPPYPDVSGQTGALGLLSDRTRHGRSKKSAKPPPSRAVVADDSCTTHV